MPKNADANTITRRPPKMSFESSYDRSRWAFENIVKPILEGDFGCRITIKDDSLFNVLDLQADIDAVWSQREYGVKGMACRVQYGRNFKTFTIRKSRPSGAKTEAEKLRTAIDNRAFNSFFPQKILQAYVDDTDGILFGYAIANTEDVIKMIDLGRCNVKKVNNDGAAEFYIVKWSDMKKYCYPITYCNDFRRVPDKFSKKGFGEAYS